MRIWLLAVAFLLLTACSAFPVSVDYQPGYDFNQVERYYWLPPSNDPQPASIHNSELVTERVAQAVENELLSRGILRTEIRAEADVLVSYEVGVEKLVEINSFMALEGSFSRHRGGLGIGLLGAPSREYKEVTLVIDLQHPADLRLLWRGMVERRLHSFKTPQEYSRFIVESVEAVLDRYPPLP